MTPLVSVCVLTYNHEAFIQQCLESILAQETTFPIEIIIADDCSTDNNRTLIEEFKTQFPDNFSLVYHRINMGVMATVISMLRAAKGKYIAICEGDDFWIDPQKLEKQKQTLDQNAKYSMICTNRYILSLTGEKIPDSAYVKDIYTIEDVVAGFIPGTQTIMFRNYPTLPDFLQKHRQIYSADRYIAYFCSLLGDIYRLKDITAVYRVTENGVWSKISSIDRLKLIFEQMISFHKSIGIPVVNKIAAQQGFKTSLSFFLYALKRPHMLKHRDNWTFIMYPFKLFKNMGRFSLLLTAIGDRVRKKSLFL